MNTTINGQTWDASVLEVVRYWAPCDAATRWLTTLAPAITAQELYEQCPAGEWLLFFFDILRVDDGLLSEAATASAKVDVWAADYGNVTANLVRELVPWQHVEGPFNRWFSEQFTQKGLREGHQATQEESAQ